MLLIDKNYESLCENPIYGEVAEEVGTLFHYAPIIKKEWWRQVNNALIDSHYRPDRKKIHGLKDLPYAYLVLASLHDYFNPFKLIITSELQELQEKDYHIGVSPLFCKMCLREIRNDLMQRGMLPDTGAAANLSETTMVKKHKAEIPKPKQRQLPAGRQRALDSFIQALCKNEVLVKAKLADIYNWIMDPENLENDKNPYKGVREKPKKKTWKSYLRQACKHYGTSTDAIREKAEKEWLYEKSKGHEVVYAINIDYHSSRQLD